MTMENKQQLNEQELGKAAGGSVVATVGAAVTAVETVKTVVDAVTGGSKKTETKATTPAGPTNTINNTGDNNKNVIVNGNNDGGIKM